MVPFDRYSLQKGEVHKIFCKTIATCAVPGYRSRYFLRHEGFCSSTPLCCYIPCAATNFMSAVGTCVLNSQPQRIILCSVEYQCFFPVVWIESPHLLSRKRVCPPHGPGGTHSLAGEGVGGPNSDDWTETLVLYIVYSFTLPTSVGGGVVSLKGSHRMGFRQKSINRSSWWTVPLMLLLLYQSIIADHIL